MAWNQLHLSNIRIKSKKKKQKSLWSITMDKVGWNIDFNSSDMNINPSILPFCDVRPFQQGPSRDSSIAYHPIQAHWIAIISGPQNHPIYRRFGGSTWSWNGPTRTHRYHQYQTHHKRTVPRINATPAEGRQGKSGDFRQSRTSCATGSYAENALRHRQIRRLGKSLAPEASPLRSGEM
ncbi:hypothetical protein ASPWEDRAFT_642882 [Aspergillus wentii DTO 134E9]|uniref:Uncharacterized protein n=1 Tax=Aspergillus wentii DTO 134E9 TaxID=1073089 RepID=A0A1L9RAG4_ASPWE|nr:uncharacterized protein ASPWEDRAFT_642882 [Aspergillus wentii DTO 134E9]OJJ31914.1 hypothetical protein ASPWEDRAFT_642882 [Aspergillus wentii DTO 134E9]